jgi:hypothetical protein
MPNKPGPKNELPPHVRTSQCTFSLDKRTVELLAVIGEGNMSRGVRLAAEMAYENYQLTGKLPTKNPPAA